MRAHASLALASLLLAGPLIAQSYDELTMHRRRPVPYSSLLQIRAGALGGFPDEEVEAFGREDDFSFDGHIYYHDERFGERELGLDAYAGRDGAVLALTQMPPGQSGQRLELTTRYIPFYREGFYSRGDFIPTGRYEGNDYSAYLGLNNEAADGLLVEVGGFWRDFSFDRNSQTGSFIIPDDYTAYGIRSYLEQNTLTLDRQTGAPIGGFLLTVRIEREWNDSDISFGTPLYQSRLPSAVWRGAGALEWYIPQGTLGTWDVQVRGQVSDPDDRVYNNDAQKPNGQLWVDGDLGFRFAFGGLYLTPLAKFQFLQTVNENGVGRADDFFFGAGAKIRYDVNEWLSFYADYSYLENESRPSVSLNEDHYGSHQFAFGGEFRFGQPN